MTLAHDIQTLAVDELQGRVDGLVGQPFANARMSYGNELRLSFGAGAERADRWTLGTRAARWVLLGPVEVLARETDGREGPAAFRAIDGAVIAGVAASRRDRALALVFDSGHRFIVLPNKPHRTPDDLDLWELFSPNGWWLAVRRDGSIEVVPDEMPLAERQRRHRPHRAQG